MQKEWDIISDYNLLENINNYYKYDKQNLYNSYSTFNNNHFKTDSIEFSDDDQLVVNCYKQPIFLYSYYLDLNKEKYNTLEKYVYDIAKFHFNRLNLVLSNEYTIEYFLNDKFTENRTLHFDHEEIESIINNKVITPFLTTLTYFNDSIYPTIITNIDETYNVLSNKNKLHISFPKYGKHISFEGGKYLHECGNIFNKKLKINSKKNIENDRFILNVLFWDKKLDYKPHFCSTDLIDTFYYDKLNPLLLFKEREQTKHINYPFIDNFFMNIVSNPIRHNSYYELETILIDNGYLTGFQDTFIIKK